MEANSQAKDNGDDSQQGPTDGDDPDQEDHVIVKQEASQHGQGRPAIEQQAGAVGARGEQLQTPAVENTEMGTEQDRNVGVMQQDAVDPGGTVKVHSDDTGDPEALQQDSDIHVTVVGKTEQSTKLVHVGIGPRVGEVTNPRANALVLPEEQELQRECSDLQQRQTGLGVGQGLADKVMDEQQEENDSRASDSISVHSEGDISASQHGQGGPAMEEQPGAVGSRDKKLQSGDIENTEAGWSEQDRNIAVIQQDAVDPGGTVKVHSDDTGDPEALQQDSDIIVVGKTEQSTKPMHVGIGPGVGEVTNPGATALVLPEEQQRSDPQQQQTGTSVVQGLAEKGMNVQHEENGSAASDSISVQTEGDKAESTECQSDDWVKDVVDDIWNKNMAEQSSKTIVTRTSDVSRNVALANLARSQSDRTFEDNAGHSAPLDEGNIPSAESSTCITVGGSSIPVKVSSTPEKKENEELEEFHDCSSDFITHIRDIQQKSLNQGRSMSAASAEAVVTHTVDDAYDEDADLERFKTECRQRKLKAQTIRILIEEDYDSEEALQTLTEDDINGLKGIKGGQLGILRKWVKALQLPVPDITLEESLLNSLRAQISRSSLIPLECGVSERVMSFEPGAASTPIESSTPIERMPDMPGLESHQETKDDSTNQDGNVDDLPSADNVKLTLNVLPKEVKDDQDQLSCIPFIDDDGDEEKDGTDETTLESEPNRSLPMKGQGTALQGSEENTALKPEARENESRCSSVVNDVSEETVSPQPTSDEREWETDALDKKTGSGGQAIKKEKIVSSEETTEKTYENEAAKGSGGRPAALKRKADEDLGQTGSGNIPVKVERKIKLDTDDRRQTQNSRVVVSPGHQDQSTQDGDSKGPDMSSHAEPKAALPSSDQSKEENHLQAFKEECKKAQLKVNTVAMLLKDDFDNTKAVSAMTQDDIDSLPGISKGQKRTLEKWVEELQPTPLSRSQSLISIASRDNVDQSFHGPSPLQSNNQSIFSQEDGDKFYSAVGASHGELDQENLKARGGLSSDEQNPSEKQSTTTEQHVASGMKYMSTLHSDRLSDDVEQQSTDKYRSSSTSQSGEAQGSNEQTPSTKLKETDSAAPRAYGMYEHEHLQKGGTGQTYAEVTRKPFPEGATTVLKKDAAMPPLLPPFKFDIDVVISMKSYKDEKLTTLQKTISYILFKSEDNRNGFLLDKLDTMNIKCAKWYVLATEKNSKSYRLTLSVAAYHVCQDFLCQLQDLEQQTKNTIQNHWKAKYVTLEPSVELLSVDVFEANSLLKNCGDHFSNSASCKRSDANKFEDEGVPVVFMLVLPTERSPIHQVCLSMEGSKELFDTCFDHSKKLWWTRIVFHKKHNPTPAYRFHVLTRDWVKTSCSQVDIFRPGIALSVEYTYGAPTTENKVDALLLIYNFFFEQAMSWYSPPTLSELLSWCKVAHTKVSDIVGINIHTTRKVLNWLQKQHNLSEVHCALMFMITVKLGLVDEAVKQLEGKWFQNLLQKVMLVNPHELTTSFLQLFETLDTKQFFQNLGGHTPFDQVLYFYPLVPLSIWKKPGNFSPDAVAKDFIIERAFQKACTPSVLVSDADRKHVIDALISALPTNRDQLYINTILQLKSCLDSIHLRPPEDLKEVHSAFSYKIYCWLKYFLKGIPPAAILELYGKLKNHGLVTPKTEDIFMLTADHSISKNSDLKVASELETLIEQLDHTTPHICLMLVVHLFDSESESFYKLAMDKLKTIDFHKISDKEETMMNIATSWFTSIASRYLGQPVERQMLLTLCRKLNAITKLLSGNKVKDYLTRKVLELLHDKKEVVLQTFADMCQERQGVQECYQGCLKASFSCTKVKNPDELLECMLQTDRPLEIQSWFAADWYKFFLDLVSLPNGKNKKENRITSILKNLRFWHKIVLCEGDMANDIHQHPVTNDVKDAMEYLYNDVKNREIDLEFCKKMAIILEGPSKPTEMLVDLIAHILREKKYDVDSSDVEASLFAIFVNTQNIYSQLSMIETVIGDFVPRIISNITVDDLSEAREAVTDLRQCLDDGKQVSLREAIARVETPVARYILSNPDCDILIQLKESVIYQRICCSILGKPPSPMCIEDIILIASTTGWMKYKSLFLVQDVSETILLKDAKFWLHGIGVKNEMAIANKVLKPIIQESLLEFLSQFESRSQCLYGLEQLISELSIDVSTHTEFTNCYDRFKPFMDESNNCQLIEFQQVHKVLSDVIGTVSTEEWDVISELKSAWAIFLFIKERKNDDFRFLIDAVVDAEQQVNPKIVRYFDRLHQFIKSIVNQEYGKNIKMFLWKLRQENEKSGNELAIMLKECWIQFHDLKQLYNSVTNKDVITRHVVQQTVSKGTFSFQMNNGGKCSFTVRYRGEKGKDVTHQQSQMVEYRSRAFLLQSSSDGKDIPYEEQAQLTERYKTFVKYVTAAVDICMICKKLFRSGCFSYQASKLNVKSKKGTDLEEKRSELENDFTRWSSILGEARHEYYFLNFVYADQLWTLYNFFSTGKPNSKLHDIFKFINPQAEVNVNEIWKEHNIVNDDSDWKNVIRALGKNLGSIFSKHIYSPSRPMPNLPENSSAFSQGQETPAIVNQGDFLVVPLRKDSCYVVPTILNLYQQTTGYYPEPFQILMCTPETSAEEVGLFLRRCFNSYSVKQDDCLFCIANIEQLSHEVLFTMVNELQGIAASEKEMQLRHRLVVICRGDPQQSLLVQFASKCRSIGVLPSPVTESFLMKLRPNIQVVKSDVPGLGKTNYIHKVGFDKGRQIQTVFISSKFEKSKFIEDMKANCLNEDDILHLDISSVSNPAFLDDELFEFLVTGMLSSGTMLYHLPTKHVMIEIANAQLEVKNKMELLINALPFTSCFLKKTLKWDNFTDFVVSKSLRSPVQTVCHYLKAYDQGQLDTNDIAPAEPLDNLECKNLLQKYVEKALQKKGMSPSDMSFNIVQSFLSMLAVQLKRLSSSVHFQTAALKVTGNDQSDLKSKLFNALTDVVADFAVRSVKSSSEFQRTSQALVNEEATEDLSYDKSVERRFKGMIHWSDSNHLMVLFHDQDPDTISLIYHDLKDVPRGIKDLFDNLNAPLQDFSSQSPDELLRLLKKLVYDSTSPFQEEEFAEMLKKYALTADNFQKMVLIKWKINAGIPVIIMGDTGCGKTSLIQFLADLCGIDFEIYGFHAGITEDNIFHTVKNQNEKALKQLDKQFWVLLDEINTCDYLGLLNEILCSHTIKGAPLAPNLVFMAACNPYCLRKKNNMFTSGLEDKTVVDARSPLVYRVHPLPEGMIDYVWDFGFLSSTDERKYIEKMMNNTLQSVDLKIKTEVLCFAQKFLRDMDGSRWCVSLRDVRRCQYLMNWFQKMYTKREVANPVEQLNTEIKSLLLAVSFCYLSRLGQREERNTFKHGLMEEMQKKYRDLPFSDLIKTEQLRILACMDLQQGIAKNEALRENVFVMFVCIMAKLPLFVVGKPGSSKSLSMQILRNSLRGSHSTDKYLKTLPSLYTVSCQGSESLVSADISKVFDKALEYNEQNKNKASSGTEDELLPVVLLDEVGLAECSPHNPLKVLHALLEPGKCEFPEVAVVGISNWALDASKMNRAIHLSRPDLDKEGLFETGRTIGEDFTRDGKIPEDFQNVIRSVAYAYFEYLVKQKAGNQSKRHFHGLRDFYSLVKYLCRPLGEHEDISKLMDPMRIVKGILRNFGGFTSVSDKDETLKYFLKHLKEHLPGIEHCSAPSLDLIQENLLDKQSRHLLLLSSGDSALSIIQNQLTTYKFNHKVIFGSKFKDDQNSEDYHCKKLSEIILCMEQGTVLVLKDLDNVYGSLYDMLNQNYSTIGEKQICRVARGAFSNPICEVNKNFKCIVLIDVDKVDYTDPPFLNRFEKQVLNIMDLLNEKENQLKNKLTQWVTDHASVDGFGENINSFILNHHKELIPSLVLRNRSTEDVYLDTDDDSLQTEKTDLLLLALPDAVMRLSKSKYAAKENFNDTQITYFDLPTHLGLKGLIETVESQRGAANLHRCERNSAVGFRLVVFTHSNIYTEMESCFERPIFYQLGKLGAIKAEKQLETIIRSFWVDETKTMFFLQCQINSDASHLILARSLIENISQEKMKKHMKKNFCIIVHVDRNDSRAHCSLFNYLSGWQLVTLESLEVQAYSLLKLSKMSVVEVVRSKFYKLGRVIKNQLLHAFLCVRHTGVGRSPKDLSELIQSIIKCKPLSRPLKGVVLEVLKKTGENILKSSMNDRNNWVVAIACNHFLIAESQTLFDALKDVITSKVKSVLNATIFNIEKLHAWRCVQNSDKYLLDVWIELFQDKDIYAIPEKHFTLSPGDSFTVSGKPMDLLFPFSYVFLSNLEKNMHSSFTTEIKKYEQLVENIDDANETKSLDVWRNLTHKFRDIFDGCLNPITRIRHEGTLENYLHYFIDDICLIYTGSLPINIPRDCRLQLIKRLIQVEKIKDFHVDKPVWSQCASVCLEFLFRLWHSSTLVFDTLHMLDACILVGQVDFIRTFLNDVNEEFSMHSERLGTSPSGSGSLSSHQSRGASLESSTSSGTYSTTSDFKEDGIVEEQDDNQVEEKNEDYQYVSSDLLELAPSQRRVEHSSDIRESKGSFTDQLVNDVCLKFMPTHQLLHQCKGIRSWQNQTGKVLSVASRVGWSVPALHMLRVCNDFASLLVTVNHLPHEPLTKLAERAIKDQNQGLESVELYHLIEDLLLELESSANLESIHRFHCLYFGRCLDARDDTEMLTVILNYTLSKAFHVSYFGPVLYRCIKPFESVLCNIDAMINKRNYLDEHATLQAIDGHLTQVKLCEENSPGMQFAILCCDFMEYAVMQSDHMKLNAEDLMCISSGNDSLSVLLSKIAEVMYNAKECSLKFVCCVAFARVFLRAVAKMLSGTDIAHEGAQRLVLSASKLFSVDEGGMKERVNFTTGYILRTLYDLSDYDHLQKVCSHNLKSDIATIESIEWPDDPGWNVIGFNPFTNLPFDKDAMKALTSLIHHDHDTNPMKEYLRSVHPDKKESLLSVLMVRMYLGRIKNPPTEDEKEAARLLQELMRECGLPISYQNVANCLSGHVSSHSQSQELEVTANMKELRHKVLLLHVLSIIVSHEGFLGSLACTPSSSTSNNVFLRMFGALTDKQDEVTIFHATCEKCGCYVVSGEEWKKCPRCHSDDFKSTVMSHLDQIGNDGLDDQFVTGYFSPRAWRATRIIINCCLFGALVTGICKAPQIPSVIGADAEALANNFKHDVDALKRILNTEDRTVFSFLHKTACCLKDIGAEVLNNNEAFEKEVTSVIECWNFKEIEMYSKELPVLDLVMEMERPAGAFHHFMRVTPNRTFAGVLTELLRWGHLEQESHKYKILRFIVSNRTTIELLKFLHPLVSWTMSIKKEMGHRINRAEGAKKSVDELLDELLEGANKQQDEQIRLKELANKLKKFREAWKNLVKLKPIIANMNPNLARHMDHVDLTQKLDQYIMDSEHSVLYMMIQFLVRLQNNLINKIMWLSAESKEASNVPFMYHSSETIIVPLVPVEDVSEKDIIGAGEGAFEKVLFLIESDPRYGHGMQCSYDLDKVEFALARDLFFGKCFLQSEGRLPLFMTYEEELFFSCETLLLDIHDYIPQSELDENIKHGLNSDLEKCPYRVRDMLMNLEIVLTLLRKTGGTPKQLLVKYMDVWMKSAINTFPSKLLQRTENTIALCHISELYEYYELNYAATTIENLPRDRFCINSGEEVKKLVRDCFPKLQNLGIEQEDLVNAIKRYVVRYIRARISTLTASQLETPLQDVLLTKKSLWPRKPFHTEGFDWEKLKEVIPRDLLVRQVGEIIKECDWFLKDSHEKREIIAGWMPHAMPAGGAKKKGPIRLDM